MTAILIQIILFVLPLQLGIIYRDIKLENILLDADGHIVITDFGLSKELTAEKNGRAYSFCGTIEYMAPEVVKQQGNMGHDFAADWWSVGVLAYELLTGSSPFTHEGEKNTQHDISLRIQKGPPPLPDKLSVEVRDFISKLLIKDPKKRLGGSKVDATDIKSHPFFRRIDWEKLVRKEIPAPFRPPKDYETDTSNFSEEFTRLPIAESPCPAPPNHERLFRGYSFVSPHLLRLREAFSGQVLYSPSSVKPKVRDLMKLARSELPFFQKYQMDFSEVIGDGSFSICLKCIRRTTRDVYAVKVLKASHDAQSEIDNLIACQGHPQIVRFVEVIRDQAFTYIVLEYLDGGELFKRIQQSRRFTEIEASGIFTQIVKAVQFMHSKNIAHRDLKPENVIFASKKSNLVKVVDFGFAVRQDPSHTSVPSSAFTLEYAAPEVLSKTAIGDKAHMEACDLWSLGVILYTMLCGQSPFRSPSDSEESICGLVEKIRHGDFDTKTPAWRCVSPAARDLVTRLLNVDSERRMEMNELVNHSWLQGTTLRKSQLTPLTLAQDLTSLDLTVKAIFDAYKHAQSKGFTMFEVENAKLSQRRRHKNSSHSSESDLGRSKSSSGVVTSDLNNRSLSVESSDIEIVGEFQIGYPSGTAGDGAGITLNNNEEATKEEITENEVNCDANLAEVEVGRNNVEITETKEETEDVREHSTMEEVVEKKEEKEEVVKVEVMVETIKEVKESPVKESKRIFSHYLANMHHGFKENGEEESHPDDIFAGFSVEDIREGYKSSMRNGEICASILNSRKSQPKLRGRKRKIKTEIPNDTQSNGKIPKLLEAIPPAMAAKPARVGHRMTTRHMRREEICGRDDLFKDYIAFSYIQLN